VVFGSGAKTVLVETIRAVSDIEGVAGVHLMGYRNDGMSVEAIAESGVRRRVNTRAA
jgi:hypothetical protein